MRPIIRCTSSCSTPPATCRAASPCSRQGCSRTWSRQGRGKNVRGFEKQRPRAASSPRGAAGKFLAGLKELYRAERLDLRGSVEALTDRRVFAHLLDRLYKQKWVVFAKRP